jgi:hypothetical protein
MLPLVRRRAIVSLLLMSVMVIASLAYYLVKTPRIEAVAVGISPVSSRKTHHVNDTTEIEMRSFRGRTLRIALIFAGAPRTLTQLGVMTSHVVNVIDALGANGRDVVDVFFHINNGTMDGLRPSSGSDLNVEHFTGAILDKLVRLTSPVQVILHTDSGCSGVNGSISHHPCCTSENISRAWQNNFLQFGYLRESYRTVKAYERDNHISYDWFVRMRPDVACFEPLPSARSLSIRRYYLQTKERVHGLNTNDYIFIVPNKLSHAFFEEQIMTIFDTTCEKEVEMWPAEAVMFTYYPYLPYQALPLACVHVLAPNIAECSRLTRSDGPVIPSIFELDGSLFFKDETFAQGCTRLVDDGYFGNRSHV